MLLFSFKDAGTTEFVSYTVESLNRVCFEQIKKYEVFYTTNGTQSESVIDIIGKMVCPENCSANGVCSAGMQHYWGLHRLCKIMHRE